MRDCPICQHSQGVKTVERFAGGEFFECSSCGLHYANTETGNLTQYYREIWSEGHLGQRPYEEKMRAALEPARLEGLLREIPRYSWAVSQFRRLSRGASVLDVGCGEGGLLWAARKLGLEPHGCDLSPGAVDLARRLVGDDAVYLGTILDLPCEAQKFDCIVALEVLEHLPEVRPFVERMTWLLKPGGILLLTTPNRNRVFAVAKRALGRPHSNTDYPPHHFTRWSTAVLGGLLGEYYQDVRVGSLRYYFHHAVGRVLSYPIHAATFGRMGQSLCARAGRPRIAR